jgi:hypothetical protein
MMYHRTHRDCESQKALSTFLLRLVGTHISNSDHLTTSGVTPSENIRVWLHRNGLPNLVLEEQVLSRKV